MVELFEHTADLGLRVTAPDRDGLFSEAARGLFAVIVERVGEDEPGVERRFSIEGRRDDHLLLDWLHELLYVFETERLLMSRFEVRTGEGGLRATARTQPLDPRRHRLLHEVKAITYHRLRVERTAGGWLAELVLDI